MKNCMKHGMILALTIATCSSALAREIGIQVYDQRTIEGNLPAEISKVPVTLYAEPSAESCEVLKLPREHGYAFHLLASCKQVQTLEVGTEMNYTGKYVYFVVHDKKRVNNPARSFIAYEVSYKSPDGQVGTGFIRSLEAELVPASTLPAMARMGIPFHLIRVARDLF